MKMLFRKRVVKAVPQDQFHYFDQLIKETEPETLAKILQQLCADREQFFNVLPALILPRKLCQLLVAEDHGCLNNLTSKEKLRILEKLLEAARKQNRRLLRGFLTLSTASGETLYDLAQKVQNRDAMLLLYHYGADTSSKSSLVNLAPLQDLCKSTIRRHLFYGSQQSLPEAIDQLALPKGLHHFLCQPFQL